MATDTNEPKSKEEAAVDEIEKSPGRDDVHEQRQQHQQKEGAVTPERDAKEPPIPDDRSKPV